MSPILRLLGRDVILATLLAAGSTAVLAWVVGSVEAYAGGMGGASTAWVVMQALPWTTGLAAVWVGAWWRRSGQASAVQGWGYSPWMLALAGGLAAGLAAVVVQGLCAYVGGMTPSAGTWWQGPSGDWYLQQWNGQWLLGTRSAGRATVTLISDSPGTGGLGASPWIAVGSALLAGLGIGLCVRGGRPPL